MHLRINGKLLEVHGIYKLDCTRDGNHPGLTSCEFYVCGGRYGKSTRNNFLPVVRDPLAPETTASLESDHKPAIDDNLSFPSIADLCKYMEETTDGKITRLPFSKLSYPFW